MSGILLTAKRAHLSVSLLKDTDGVDSVLVGRLELGIRSSLALEIHLPEHVQRRLLTSTSGSGTTLLLQRAGQLPSVLVTVEAEGLAILDNGLAAVMLLSTGMSDATYMASSDNLVLAVPDQTVKRQQTGRNVQHRAGRLLRGTGVHDSNAAVVSGESEGIATRGEADTLDPASSVVQVFTTDGVEGETLAPSARFRALVNALDEAREDAGVGVGGARSQEHGVGVPRESGDGTADRLLQVLRDPPVILLLKVADGDHAGSRADGELLLGR